MPTVFDVDSLKAKIEEKREALLDPNVYANPSVATQLNKDLKVMSDKVEKLDKLETRVKDMQDYI